MNSLFAERALLPEGWRENVLLEWDADGLLTAVQADFAARFEGERAALAIPGMVNLHSHAFQRAMAGLTEYRANPADSFWSWRTLMYRFAAHLTPDILKAVARQLYGEMLMAGYTSVCEFHYLHHDAEGKAYAHPGEMSACLIEAAADAGIGLTLLPVMYQYSGFGARPPLENQARFINSPQWMLALLQDLQSAHPQHAGLRYGVAPHSLRAVSPESLRELLDGLRSFDRAAPVHIHIAEQAKEVEDCLASCGARPVQWLLDNIDVDAHWCLVHATHMTSEETEALARSGAVAGICPSTEANLGDGIFNGKAYHAAGGAWGIGSDSHICVDVLEELRLYEYSQRLLHRRRNVLAADGAHVGAGLYREAMHGGALASGRPVAGLRTGQCADLVVLDASHPNLHGKAGDTLTDSLVFARHGASPVKDVASRGKWVVRGGNHFRHEAYADDYRHALKHLQDN
ncbi:MAG TPA: formimidoylglutamate deiminase [Burkholderiaceae bacterium]